MLRTTPRSGYGLFSLLVLLAVLAVLIGMLLPAVQKVREAAARMQSANNLKQIGLACHNYMDTNNKLPPGVDAHHFSGLAHLLPFLEQTEVHRRLDFGQDADSKANSKMRAVLIKTFLNPSDAELQPDAKSGPTNYLLVAGSKNSLEDNDGIFYRDSTVRLQDITDGTSNTLFDVETLKGDGGKKAVTVARQHVRLKEADLKNIVDATGVKDFKASKNIAGNRGGAWVDGRYLQATISLTRKANDSSPDVDCGGAGGHGAVRTFAGRSNVGIADGSVRFMSAETKLTVWQALATRAGGEVIPND